MKSSSMIFFFGLAFFIQHNFFFFEIHPCGCILQQFIAFLLLSGIPLCGYITTVCSLICCWTLVLCPVWGYEHSCTSCIRTLLGNNVQ